MPSSRALSAKRLSVRFVESQSRSTLFSAKSAASYVMRGVPFTHPRPATCARSSCSSSNGLRWNRRVPCRRHLT